MTITLARDQAADVDSLVSTGKYASASEVVQAGIDALEEHTHYVKQWLQTDVAKVDDLMASDPSRGIATDDVIARLEQHHSDRLKKC